MVMAALQHSRTHPEADGASFVARSPATVA